MSYNIAVAGKGGTGKTSLTGILIDYLTKEKKGEILVVDADANANINDVLGMELNGTSGEIKEKANQMEQKREQYPGGMTKSQYLEYELNSIVEEGDGYDLLVMGRSEGEGCYCFVNSILKRQIQLMSGHYDYVVMDNEAGMEHLSRKTTKHIDTLLLVSDCSRRSIQAVARIRDLSIELNLSIGKVYLIVNKVPNGVLNDGIKEEIEKHNLNLIGVVPLDELIYQYDSDGIPLVKLPKESKSRVAMEEIVAKLELK